MTDPSTEAPVDAAETPVTAGDTLVETLDPTGERPAEDAADGPAETDAGTATAPEAAESSAEQAAEPVADQGPQPYDGEPDPVAAAAVDLAREAAREIAEPGTVGDHLGVHAEAEGVVTHGFACLAKGYRGWYWAITVVAFDGEATVSDTVLLPGDEAILAPTWVPWSDRLAPGDLRATDVLPYRADDPNLEAGYEVTDDEDADQVALWELGLGRTRVLSALGRTTAAERWYLGDRGPTAEEAVHASAACSSCGYFLPLSGALRQVFGVCANEWSPSDGRVVSLDHGCGAHSETDVEAPEPIPLPEPILDETGAEPVVIPRRSAADAAPDDEAAADAVTAEVAAEAVTDEAPVDAVAEEAPVDATTDEAPADATTDEAPADATTDEAPADATTDEAAADAEPEHAADPQA